MGIQCTTWKAKWNTNSLFLFCQLLFLAMKLPVMFPSQMCCETGLLQHYCPAWLAFFWKRVAQRRHSENWALLCWILSWIKAGVPSKHHCLWPEDSPSQRCDTRSLDAGSLTKGKSPQSLLVLLAENWLLKTALELKGIVVWKLKSHQMFHWKTGAASPGTRQHCCSWSAGGSESQGAGQARPAEQDSLLWMLLKLATVGETLALTWASGRGDRCGAGEMTGKKSTERDRRAKGLPCCQAPSLVKRPLQPDLSVSLWLAFQHYDALWFYSFLLEVLLKHKQQSISAGIKKIQIKEMRNSPSLQAHFKTH